MSSEQLQGFFESTPGQISTLIVIVLLFVGILISDRKKKADTKAMVTSAVLVALSIALNQVILFRMPQGGSITAFIIFQRRLRSSTEYRRGVMAGCASVYRPDLQTLLIHPIQHLLDYPSPSAPRDTPAFK
jgi:thiamine transporter